MGRKFVKTSTLWKLVGIYEGRGGNISIRELAKLGKVSRCCARNAIVRYKRTMNPEPNYRSEGRHRCTTSRQDRKLIQIVREHRRASLSDLAGIFQEQVGKRIGLNTLKRRCEEAGYKLAAVKKQIMLTSGHRKARLVWCRERVQWTKRKWAHVIWSDESAFQLHERKGLVRVRRRDCEKALRSCTVPREVGGGGTVMVWACFKGPTSGILLTIRGKIDSARYREILQNGLLPSLDLFDDINFIFQQDNAPVHTSRRTREWMQAEDIDLLPWPSKSPDLNPIETVWDLLDRKLRKLQLASLKDLERALHTAWLEIPPETFAALSSSMPARILKCISARGHII